MTTPIRAIQIIPGLNPELVTTYKDAIETDVRLTAKNLIGKTRSGLPGSNLALSVPLTLTE
jgi:hypothetical protein